MEDIIIPIKNFLNRINNKNFCNLLESCNSENEYFETEIQYQNSQNENIQYNLAEQQQDNQKKNDIQRLNKNGQQQQSDENNSDKISPRIKIDAKYFKKPLSAFEMLMSGIQQLQ
ncbi:hypothetical protein PPERSA_11719 [Pseudocohnilembus persalinus]|uniref:Uncharacterized protein n=1 Tax=Pseudocohnilembus persalinus TaxID=266149 RepID=A0A0V0QGL3_PSEPJ|nr:hypothetical protein PPERSA_11719 [Pseudocohnilembus persalinus]|eukprot:KRX01272.1 hypothetical protein PPERSA_11719 [Pseudocohnilembus persalinus]